MEERSVRSRELLGLGEKLEKGRSRSKHSILYTYGIAKDNLNQ